MQLVAQTRRANHCVLPSCNVRRVDPGGLLCAARTCSTNTGATLSSVTMRWSAPHAVCACTNAPHRFNARGRPFSPSQPCMLARRHHSSACPSLHSGGSLLGCRHRHVRVCPACRTAVSTGAGQQGKHVSTEHVSTAARGNKHAWCMNRLHVQDLRWRCLRAAQMSRLRICAGAAWLCRTAWAMHAASTHDRACAGHSSMQESQTSCKPQQLGLIISVLIAEKHNTCHDGV